MPRGGSRIGCGRKPRLLMVKSPRPARRDNRLLDPPDGTPEAQQAAWVLYAPHALEAGTLTMRTAGAFGLLCKLMAMENAMSEQLAEEGWICTKITTDVTSGEQSREMKAHPLVSQYRGLVQRIEVQMKNFALIPFGKPLVSPLSQGSVNPWADLTKSR